MEKGGGGGGVCWRKKKISQWCGFEIDPFRNRIRFILGVAVPCGNGSKLFYLLLQGAEENFFFILDPSGRISIVHDSDLGSGYGTMRIRIQTMLFDCFYSDLLQKILNFCKISCKWYCPIGLAVQIDTGFFRSGSGQCSGIIADPDPKRLSVA